MAHAMKLGCVLAVLMASVSTFAADGVAGRTKIVFVAGKPSHSYAQHEHYAGCLLLADCLRKGMSGVDTAVHRNGWPRDPKAFDGAVAIVLFSDGSEGNPMMPHLDEIGGLMKKGIGLACIHYAVEVPKGKAGDCLLDWIGGYFETFWSVNPFFVAEFKQFPEHPITRGVKPFAVEDEWYYHMRFAKNMEGVTPILSVVPPDSTRREGNTARGGNPHVRARKGMPEHVAWAKVRADGGRGFGFTGGHHHWNWGNTGFRTIVLNGIVWVAKLDVPPGGVPSSVTFESLEPNQDKTQPANFDRQKTRTMVEQWSK